MATANETCPESLCARILKAVYYPMRDILPAEVGNNPSLIWRSIVEGRDILKQGLIRRIGNGTTTSIWGHNSLVQNMSIKPVLGGL